MKRILIIFFIVFNLSSSFGQRLKIDSLIQIIPTLKIDSIYVQTIIELSYSYVYINADSAVFYADKAIELSLQLKNKHLEAISYLRKGLAFWIKGDLYRGFQYTQICLRIAEKIKDENIINRSLNNISLIYYGMNNYQMALYYQNLTRDYLKKNNLTYRYNLNLLNTANTYLRMQKYDSVEIKLQEVKSLLSEDITDLHIFLYQVWGELKVIQKDYKTAKEYLNKSIDYGQESLNFNVYLSIAQLSLAEIAYEENKLDSAEMLALKAINIVKKRKMKEGLFRSYLLMSKIYLSKKDYENALKFKDLYILYKDSVQNEATNYSIQIFNYQREQGEIASLQKEKELEKIKSETQKKLFTWVITFFLTFSLGLFYIIWHKQKNNKLLKIQKEKLSSNLIELNKTQEELEQNRKSLIIALADNQSITKALNSAAIVSITDLKGNILEINKNFCQISGYEESEIIGKSHNIVNSGFHSKSFWSKMWKTISKGEVWRGEVCNKAKNSTLYWVDTVISPVIDKNGNIFRYISIKYLITERKQAMEQVLKSKIEIQLKNKKLEAQSIEINSINKILNKNLEKISIQKQLIEIQATELTKVNATKDKLFSIISHDLRAPLAALKGMIEVIKIEDLSGVELNSYMSEINNSLDVNLLMLDNLLIWSRNQMLSEKIELKEVSLNEQIEICYLLFKNVLLEKMININTNSIEKIIVYADKDIVQFILRNLLSNAIKFTHKGGKIEINILHSNNYGIIEVKDSGKGIPKENIDRIFELKNERSYGTDNEKGTGLGLPLCKSYIEKMGGRIEVTSTLGEGSVFIVKLPLYQ
jgi:PAS domain S-box-containing protein